MAELKFVRADNENNLPEYQDGQLIFTKDGQIFLDFPDEERIPVGGKTEDDTNGTIIVTYSSPTTSMNGREINERANQGYNIILKKGDRSYAYAGHNSSESQAHFYWIDPSGSQYCTCSVNEYARIVDRVVHPVEEQDIQYIRTQMDLIRSQYTDIQYLYKKLQVNNTFLTPITHAQLQILRDIQGLTPGMHYQITDYQCCSLTPNTHINTHQFDIIVEATGPSTLSEKAMAIQHNGNLEIMSSIIESAYNKRLIPNSVEVHYMEYTDGGDYTGEDADRGDVFIAYDYLINPEGIEVPVLYKIDGDELEANPQPPLHGIDYDEAFYYIGRSAINNVTYDKWRKINIKDPQYNWDTIPQIFMYTNIIVNTNGAATNTTNYQAWKLNYCFDNDRNRFNWVDDTFNAIINLNSHNSHGQPLTRQPAFDKDASEIFRYAWGATADVADGDSTNFIYSHTETPHQQEVYNESKGQYEIAIMDQVGKGVIYYMKDEYGNEAPFDFKNIQFLHPDDQAYHYAFSLNEQDGTTDGQIVNCSIGATYDGAVQILPFAIINSTQNGYSNIVIEPNCFDITIDDTNYPSICIHSGCRNWRFAGGGAYPINNHLDFYPANRQEITIDE